jgi:hypothetical protein
VISCARRVWLPPGGPGLPGKPQCSGGKIIAILTLPPRWKCVCPKGKLRIQVGKNAYVCKGWGGDPDAGVKACIKKGGIWTGKKCIVPDPKPCPPGWFGKPPNCKKIFMKKCPPGFIGWEPNCKKIFLKKKQGEAPKKDFKKDVKIRRDVKKAFEAFKRRQKKD